MQGRKSVLRKGREWRERLTGEEEGKEWVRGGGCTRNPLLPSPAPPPAAAPAGLERLSWVLVTKGIVAAFRVSAAWEWFCGGRVR